MEAVMSAASIQMHEVFPIAHIDLVECDRGDVDQGCDVQQRGVEDERK